MKNNNLIQMFFLLLVLALGCKNDFEDRSLAKVTLRKNCISCHIPPDMNTNLVKMKKNLQLKNIPIDLYLKSNFAKINNQLPIKEHSSIYLSEDEINAVELYLRDLKSFTWSNSL